MKWRRWAKEIALTVALVGIVMTVMHYRYAPNEASQHLPDLRLPLSDGNIFDSAGLDKRGVILYFFMPSCPVCKLEAPVIEALRQHYRIVAIGAYGDRATIAKHLRKEGVSFPFYTDERGELARRFGIQAYPTILIYDANATRRFSLIGYTTRLGIETRMRML